MMMNYVVLSFFHTHSDTEYSYNSKEKHKQHKDDCATCNLFAQTQPGTDSIPSTAFTFITIPDYSEAVFSSFTEDCIVAVYATSLGRAPPILS